MTPAPSKGYSVLTLTFFAEITRLLIAFALGSTL
jgi:hypothetical protein